MLLEIEKILKRLEVQTKEKKAQKNRINHIFCSLFFHIQNLIGGIIQPLIFIIIICIQRNEEVKDQQITFITEQDFEKQVNDPLIPQTKHPLAI